MRPALVLALAVAVLAACGPNQTVPPDHAPFVGPQIQPLACMPNLDGQIDAAEFQPALGVPETLLVTPAGGSEPVDLVGSVDAQGKRIWDLTADDGTDQIASLQASALAGKWYASAFPGGQYVTPIDLADTLEGVYAQDGSGIYLLGEASTQEHPPEGKTLLVYDQPVAIYRFPLRPGASWVSAGAVRNGTFRDLPYASVDTYQVTVAAAGTVELPDLTFTQAMRVKIGLTIAPSAGASVTTQQSSWLFECFGEVARATSEPGETNPDFTTAAELRRLSLQRSTP